MKRTDLKKPGDAPSGALKLDDKLNAELDDKYLTFYMGRQLLAVPIADVVQIIGVQEITEIPEFPDYAKGIINLRGSIIPIISVRLRLGKEEIPVDDRTCIIVTNINEMDIGFLVDGVDEVTTIVKSEISPPPKVSAEVTNIYLTGIGKHEEHVILMLDPAKIMSESELASLQSNL